MGFGPDDGAALRELRALAAPDFPAIAVAFYDRILAHEGARLALVGGESQVGHLRTTLVRWMEEAIGGPWDESWWEAHCRIGRVHVRIDLPQHYMFGAMNVVREELSLRIDRLCARGPGAPGADPCRAREGARPRARHHAPHLPGGPALPGHPVGAARHLRAAGRLDRPRAAQPAGRDRELALPPARPDRGRRPGEEAPRPDRRTGPALQPDHHRPPRHGPRPPPSPRDHPGDGAPRAGAATPSRAPPASRWSWTRPRGSPSRATPSSSDRRS